MGIFRRRRGEQPATPPAAPDAGLPMFDGPHAARFATLAREVFAEHGLECTYVDGYLRGTDGRSYGLTNVALIAVHGAEREWRALLTQHAAGIVVAHATPKVRDIAEIGDRLYLRLWSADELPQRPHVAEPLGEGLIGLVSIDHPEHVETLTGAQDIELLGGWDDVRRVALTNLGALRAEDVLSIGDDPAARVQLSVGGFFNASRVFTMERLLAEDFLIERPPHGVLFVVPNRHLVAVHPLAGDGLVGAVATLLRLARGESDVPGSISPQVWFWRDGVVQQVSRPAANAGGDGAEGAERTVELHVEGALELAMRELGLVDDSD